MNSAVSRSHYPFDNAAPQAGDRFASLATLYDEVTRRHLDRLGIGAGWNCLEVGAGGGSVARFMSERVGPTGHVVATDINIDWMAGSLPANVELRRHDIGVDPLPERAFDIVHARAVLTFVPERQSALMRMVAALKPGGWLLVEELVPPVTEALDPPDEPDVEIARKGRHAIVEIIRRRGGDPFFARELPELVTAVGPDRLRCGGLFRPVSYRRGRWARQGEHRPTRVAAIVEAGLMNAAELDRYRSVLGRPDCLISRINGADFRVGTATTALTFERIGHGEGARRCDSGRCDYWLCFYRQRLWLSVAAKTLLRRAGRISPHSAWRCFPPGQRCRCTRPSPKGFSNVTACESSSPRVRISPSSWLLLPRASTTSRRACRRLC